jgi:hypothetical protein
VLSGTGLRAPPRLAKLLTARLGCAGYALRFVSIRKTADNLAVFLIHIR